MRNSNERLHSAIHALFVPLATLLLKNGQQAAPIVDLLKIAFVDAAKRKANDRDKPVSINKISKTTGFSRKHVQSLLDRRATVESMVQLAAPTESAILTTWTSLDRFLDRIGQPRLLELGPGPGTFADLVRTATGEDSTLNYLNRLSQANCILIRDDERIEMVRREFLFSDDLPRLIATILVPLVTTLSENWDDDYGRRRCVRVTHSNRIDPTKSEMLKRISKERIGRFLEEMDDLICSKELRVDDTNSAADSETLKHVGIGAYYFELDE